MFEAYDFSVPVPLDEKPKSLLARAVDAVYEKLPHIGTMLGALALGNGFNSSYFYFVSAYFMGGFVQDFFDMYKQDEPGTHICYDDYSNAQMDRLLSILRINPQANEDLQKLENYGWSFSMSKTIVYSKKRRLHAAGCCYPSYKKITVDKFSEKADFLTLHTLSHEIRHSICYEEEPDFLVLSILKDRENSGSFWRYLLPEPARIMFTHNRKDEEIDANQYADDVLKTSFPVEYALYKLETDDANQSLFRLFTVTLGGYVERKIRERLLGYDRAVIVKPVSPGISRVSLQTTDPLWHADIPDDKVDDFKKAYKKYMLTKTQRVK